MKDKLPCLHLRTSSPACSPVEAPQWVPGSPFANGLVTRFEAAKLLLELDDTVNTAVEILESLLEENDSVPDVYQLLAMCLFGGGEHQEVHRCCPS